MLMISTCFGAVASCNIYYQPLALLKITKLFSNAFLVRIP